MIRQIAGALVVVTFFGVLAGVLWLDAQNNAEIMTRRDTLPSMVRAGEMAVNDTTLYLWKFEFEGKQCLWATTGHRSGGGLTCWKETE